MGTGAGEEGEGWRCGMGWERSLMEAGVGFVWEGGGFRWPLMKKGRSVVGIGVKMASDRRTRGEAWWQ